jgi:hypothetical protein
MRQNTMSALAGLASFAQWQDVLAPRSHEGCAEGKRTCEACEGELGHAVRGLANALKAADLARDDVDADAVMVDGQEWRKCLTQQPKTSLSASGPITVGRNLYRPAAGGKCLCPLELRAGIIGGWYTPVLARQVTDLMGHMTTDETSKVCTDLGIAGPSRSRCDRLPKLLSAVWERHREPWGGALRHQEVVAAEAAVVAVSLDGVMVPDKEAQRAAKATREAAQQQGWSKQCSGPAGYRDVGCGTVTLCDADATQLDTVRYGRAPEYKKQPLTAQLDAELASMLAVRPDVALVALADGAEENWRYLERPVYDKAAKIVDHGHASQHLRAAMAAYDGEQRVTGRAEYARLRMIRRDQPGGADDVSAALARLVRKTRGQPHKRRRKLLNAALTYFMNQRERLDSAEDQARGLPMGSGRVEAACKTLATQRLKRSGMSWRDGKQALRTVRSLQQSNRWAATWARLSAHFRVGVMEVRQHGPLRELVLAQKAALCTEEVSVAG